MGLEVLNIMATTKKTTTKKTGVAIETTPKKTTTRRKTGTTATSTTGTKTTTKKTTTTKTTDVAALQAQVTTLENKLQNLINVLYAEFSTEILQGPRGTARKLEEAGLTD
tara:strand:+ start:130 stop:459 length:330 start_codon:yes stop_codon:yes gene_type:complete